MTRLVPETMRNSIEGEQQHSSDDDNEVVENNSEIEASQNADAELSDWTGEYVWKIDNFSRCKERKLYSERFDIGSYIWRLLIFPRGNDNQRPSDYIAIYLDFSEAAYTPMQLCPKARFELMAVNQKENDNSLKREATHIFTSQATDWGFTQFLPLSDLNSSFGYLVNDTLIIKVSIDIQKDDQIYRNTRKLIGCVGLKNQGATCYMNSLLQYLYHIPYFRKAVYHMPIAENDEPDKCIPLALQSLFFKLQYQNSSVSTKDLTKSFGWGTYDAFLQHDIQEMQAILCEKLEEKMKGTKVEKVIEELFFGHYLNYIECVDVDMKSITKQPYMEIPLDIAGFKDIYESLDKFCEEEKLEGENRYSANEHGLRDARRYTKFFSFPPILQLHLKRFAYDSNRNGMIKINDKFKFYNELNLDRYERKFLAPDSDKSIVNKYKLHSVLVHSGGAHGGHYYAFIKPKDKWLKFDDEMVKEEEEDKAIKDQYGDEDSTTVTYSHGLRNMKQSTAYLLVYIREMDWDRIMCSVDKYDIAEHIRKRLETEQEEKERKHKEKQEAHMYVMIKVAGEKHLKTQIGDKIYFDLVNFESVESYRIHKNTSFEDFKEMISKDFGIAKEKQRFWIWVARQNGTVRLDKPLLSPECDVEIKTVLDLRHFKERHYQGYIMDKNALMTIKLFLETPSENAAISKEINQNEKLLLFCKYFDPLKKELSYLGHIFVESNMEMRNVFQKIKREFSLPDDIKLIGYEEIKYDPLVDMNDLSLDTTPEEAQFIHGDILILQPDMSDIKRAFKGNRMSLSPPSARSFLQHIQNSKTVNFRPLNNPKDEGFKLEMLKTMTYDEVTSQLAKHLSVDDSDKIRLTQHNVYAHQPHKMPIKYRGMESLEYMTMHSRQNTNILYYEILDEKLSYIETLKCMTIAFHDNNTRFQSQEKIWLPKDKTVKDLLNGLKKKVSIDENESRDMRLMEILSSKIFKVLELETVLDSLHETYWNFRAEFISDEEKDLQSDEYLIHVCHCKTDGSDVSIFGDPFWLKIKKGETLGDIKPRIQKKLEVKDDEFSKWRFAYHPRQLYPLEYFDDDSDVLSKFPRFFTYSNKSSKYFGDNTSFLVLEHDDLKQGRRIGNTVHYSYEQQRGVKIYSN